MAHAAGQSRTLRFLVNVPAGTPQGLYPVDFAQRGNQTAYIAYETYWRKIATIIVGERRSEDPVINCPVDRNDTSISGTSSEPDGTVITLYFNDIGRATTTVSSGSWTVNEVVWDDGTPTTFGEMYPGLEIRATADAPAGQGLESEKSTACFVSTTPVCSDGIDNDGDGLLHVGAVSALWVGVTECD